MKANKVQNISVVEVSPIFTFLGIKFYKIASFSSFLFSIISGVVVAYLMSAISNESFINLLAPSVSGGLLGALGCTLNQGVKAFIFIVIVGILTYKMSLMVTEFFYKMPIAKLSKKRQGILSLTIKDKEALY